MGAEMLAVGRKEVVLEKDQCLLAEEDKRRWCWYFALPVLAL